jgi:hypothetical protein
MRLPHDMPSARCDERARRHTGEKTFVIQIKKGTAPKETIDKNNKLAEDLKTIYKVLAELYAVKKKNSAKVELTKAGLRHAEHRFIVEGLG